MIKYFNIIVCAVFLCSCGNKSVNLIEKETVAISNPPGAIPFEYEETKQKAIVLNGMLNDSIPLKIIFDTGYITSGITISDSLQNIVGEEYTQSTLKIENRKQLVDIHYLNKNDRIFQYIGANAAFVGLDYFENKIVEISYQYKYIRELDDIDSRIDYKCIKITRSKNGYFRIPIEIFLQQKWINAQPIIDTGYNGLIDLDYQIIDKYAINIDSAKYMTAWGLHNKSKGKIFVPIDSIKAGYTIHNNYPLGAGFIKSRFYGLLGNAFFENFDVILDLKEDNLYLKPIEQK